MPVFVKKVSECEVATFRSFITSKLGDNSSLELVNSAELKSDKALREKVFMGQITRNPKKISDPKQKYGNFWRLWIADLSGDCCKPEVRVWVYEHFTDFPFHKGDFFAVTNADVTRPAPSLSATAKPCGIIVNEKLQATKIWVMTTKPVDEWMQLSHSTSSNTLSEYKCGMVSSNKPVASPTNSCSRKAVTLCEDKFVSPNSPRVPLVYVQESQEPHHSKDSGSGGLTSPRILGSQVLQPVEHATPSNSRSGPSLNASTSRVQNGLRKDSPSTVLVSSAVSPEAVQACRADKVMPQKSPHVASQHSPSSVAGSKDQNKSPSKFQDVLTAMPINIVGSPYIYTKIKDLKPGVCNVIGVVTADVKPASTSKHGDSYITVCVSDQSSPLMLIVTIFNNTKEANILPQIKANDVIRFHRLKIDSKNVNFFGLLKSAIDFCVWSFPEYGMKAPKTIAKTYSYTDEEAAMVRRLATWVSSVQSPDPIQAPVVASFISEPTTTIKDMIKTGYYNLMCQVVDSYQPVTTCQDPFILRVWDNTAPIHPSVVWDLPPDHSNSDMYLDLEKFVVSVGIYGTKYVSLAEELKCGDIILLVNLHAKIYLPNPQYPDPRIAFYMHPDGEKFHRSIRLAQGHQRETFFAMLKDAVEKRKAENAASQQATVNNSPSPGKSSGRLRSGRDVEITTAANESQNNWNDDFSASVEQRLWVEVERNFQSVISEVNGNSINTDSRNIRNLRQNDGDCRNVKSPLTEIPSKRMKRELIREGDRRCASAETCGSESSSSFVDMDLEESQVVCTSKHPPVSSGSTDDALDGLPSLRFVNPEDNISGVSLLSWSSPECNSTSVKINLCKEKPTAVTKASHKNEPPTSITTSQPLGENRVYADCASHSPSCEIISPPCIGTVDKDSLDLEMLIREIGESSNDNTDKPSLNKSKEVSLVSDTESEEEYFMIAKQKTKDTVDQLEPFQATILNSNSDNNRFSYEQSMTHFCKAVTHDSQSANCHKTVPSGTVTLVDLVAPTLCEDVVMGSTDIQRLPGSVSNPQTTDVRINKSIQDRTTHSKWPNSEQLKEGESHQAIDADCSSVNIHGHASSSLFHNKVESGSRARPDTSSCVLRPTTDEGKKNMSNRITSLLNDNSTKLYSVTSFQSYKTGLLNLVRELPVMPINKLHEVVDGEMRCIKAKILSFTPSTDEPLDLLRLYCSRCCCLGSLNAVTNMEKHELKGKECCNCPGVAMKYHFLVTFLVCDESGQLKLHVCKDAAVMFFKGITPSCYVKDVRIQLKCRILLELICPQPNINWSWADCPNSDYVIAVKFTTSGGKRQYCYIAHSEASTS